MVVPFCMFMTLGTSEKTHKNTKLVKSRTLGPLKCRKLTKLEAPNE